VEDRAAAESLPVHSLESFEEVMEAAWDRWLRSGVVGMKVNDLPLPPGDRSTALAAWRRLQRGEDCDLTPLHAYLHDYLYRLCARRQVTVAIHTGFFWGDYRVYDVKHTIPIVMRHPDTRFDLYHAGMPNIRDSGFVAKSFPNVYLDLTWAHMISEETVRAGLQEWLDLVPANKILAFGGDHSHTTAEKVVGHLALARENIATVLAERMERGRLTMDDALFLARCWFWDNPLECYRLEL
jgi:predicted TIM-barrel fold metal-dependent hydrolase